MSSIQPGTEHQAERRRGAQLDPVRRPDAGANRNSVLERGDGGGVSTCSPMETFYRAREEAGGIERDRRYRANVFFAATGADGWADGDPG